MSDYDYLSEFNDKELLTKIEILKGKIKNLQQEKQSMHNPPLNIDCQIDIYQNDIDDFEEELNRRFQRLSLSRNRLSKAVSRNKSHKAVTTLLSRPHYSEFPKTMTGRLFSSFVGETGLSRYILNHITGEDLLPNKDRVYLRELQDKINLLPEDVVRKIWKKLSKNPCVSNIRENHYLENEPMPERSNSSGGKQKRYKTRRNKK